MFTKNGNILKINGNWLNPHVEPEPYPFEEVTIGTQTWMAKNLDIDDGGTGITITDNVTANGVNFGTQYYYNWNAAVRVAASVEGWHLPTQAEWDALATAVGGESVAGTKLKSTTGWDSGIGNGTDDYGFTAFPAGYYYGNSDTLNYVGCLGYFWTSNEYSSTEAYFRYFYTEAIGSTNALIGSRFSVRLIKDT